VQTSVVLVPVPVPVPVRVRAQELLAPLEPWRALALVQEPASVPVLERVLERVLAPSLEGDIAAPTAAQLA
jgi:hypothetical protein